MGTSVDPEAIQEAPFGSQGETQKKQNRKTSSSSTSSRSSGAADGRSAGYRDSVSLANPGDSFEELLEVIGTNGRWNYFLFLLCSLGAFISPLQNLSYQFLGATPDHWCRIEPLIQANWTQEQIIDFAIPRKPNENGTIEGCLQRDYDYDAVAKMGYEEAMANLGVLPDVGHTTVSCTKRVYNLTQFASTVVTQWDLVCEKRALYSTTQSSAQAGKLVGSLVFGYLTDTFGRRRVTLASVCFFVLFSFLAASATTINLYITLRALISFFDTGFYMSCFVLALENCSPNQRSFVGALYAVPWAFGYMVLPGIAYAVRNWQWLQVALSLPSLLLFLYFGLLPESLRWLIMQGRLAEALVLIKRAAAVNQRKLPRTKSLLDTMEKIYNKAKYERQRVAVDGGGFCVLLGLLCRRVQRLCSTTRLLVQTCIVFFSWFSVSLVYYGVALNAANLSANEYLYMFLGGALEIPSYLLLWPATALLGRKKSFIALFALCAVSIFASLSVDQAAVSTTMTLFLLGKLAVTSAFQLVFLFTAELYPTGSRALALGGANLCARIGSTVSPYINDLVGEVNHQAPAQLFGALSCITALLALFLPETNRHNLTEGSTTVAPLETKLGPPQVTVNDVALQGNTAPNVPTIEVQSESSCGKDNGKVGSVIVYDTSSQSLDERHGQDDDDEVGDKGHTPNDGEHTIKLNGVASDSENNRRDGVGKDNTYNVDGNANSNIGVCKDNSEKPGNLQEECEGQQNVTCTTQL